MKGIFGFYAPIPPHPKDPMSKKNAPTTVISDFFDIGMCVCGGGTGGMTKTKRAWYLRFRNAILDDRTMTGNPKIALTSAEFVRYILNKDNRFNQ